MKKLFSTTCIPADADISKRRFLSRFARDENGNVTMLSVVLIATGAVLSGIAWDLNHFEHRRVGLQQVADRAVLAAADLDQTLDPAVVVQDYFAKAGYPDVVSSVNVDEGLNYRTVSVNVNGLVAANTIQGSYSGEVTLGGNHEAEARKIAEQRKRQNRPLDEGMTFEQILDDVIENEFKRGGVTREESDRLADLRLLLRDSRDQGDANIEWQELVRLRAAQNNAIDPDDYTSDEARSIAATLTQDDARQLVRLRQEILDQKAKRAQNMAGYVEDYDLTADERALRDAINSGSIDAVRAAANSITDAGERQTALDQINTKISELNTDLYEDQWEASQREDGNYIELQAFAEAEERVNNVEISLVLDISGSMSEGDKMTNLRNAARTFVDAVLNPSTEDLVSINIVPYSEHVSVGPEIMAEFNVNRTHNYSHCIEFEDADFNTTALPVSNGSKPRRYEQVQHFYWGNTSWNQRTVPICPDGEHEDIVAFSQNVTDLKTKIGQLNPTGSTSIFAGMKWAAGLLDPSFQPRNANLAQSGVTDPVFANRPVAFDDHETLKTVILMTDGKNHYSKRINPQVYANSSHWAHWDRNNFDWWVHRNVYSWNRPLWSEAKYWPEFGDQLLSNVCSAAKENNIVIWSIGFEVSTYSANVMRNCASSPSHYFGVEGVEIREAFSAIARQINQLRLTQ